MHPRVALAIAQCNCDPLEPYHSPNPHTLNCAACSRIVATAVQSKTQSEIDNAAVRRLAFRHAVVNLATSTVIALLSIQPSGRE